MSWWVAADTLVDIYDMMAGEADNAWPYTVNRAPPRVPTGKQTGGAAPGGDRTATDRPAGTARGRRHLRRHFLSRLRPCTLLTILTHALASESF